jgi:hypothetical protein
VFPIPAIDPEDADNDPEPRPDDVISITSESGVSVSPWLTAPADLYTSESVMNIPDIEAYSQ